MLQNKTTGFSFVLYFVLLALSLPEVFTSLSEETVDSTESTAQCATKKTKWIWGHGFIVSRVRVRSLWCGKDNTCSLSTLVERDLSRETEEMELFASCDIP